MSRATLTHRFGEVCFLDFDGVLNLMGNGQTDLSKPDFEPALMARMNRFVEARPNLRIVVSSTWRRAPEKIFRMRGGTMTWLREQLMKGGFAEVDRVVDCTPETKPSLRGLEIAQWLTWHGDEVLSVVVIDDAYDKLQEMRPMLHRTVWVEGLVGVSDADLEKADKILATPFSKVELRAS